MTEDSNSELNFLKNRIAELELENALLKKGISRIGANSKTVTVPKEVQHIFDQAEKNVRKYFAGIEIDPPSASIQVDDERYVLVRASALSYGFFKKIIDLYADRGEEEAVIIGKNLLFDLAHVIGIEDAKNFHQRMNLNDPIEKLSAGPVHFAYTGWAFVEILPESNPAPNDDFFLSYRHPYSFEADSWLKSNDKSNFPVCVMNSGYSSGWCEQSFGIPLTAVELTCRAKGDEHCSFVMAPPHRINDYLLKAKTSDNKQVYDVPLFFERKKAEEKIKASLHEKEILLKEIHHRVKNNLQIISSLIKLQTSHIHDEVLTDLLLSSQQRVKTMAIVHEKLYESDLQYVNVSSYIHSIALMIADTFAGFALKIQFEFDFIKEELHFKIDKAIPCGLIINELITNAFKYAFNGLESGKVYIGLKKSENKFVIIIHDNGIGLAESINPATSKTMGFELVEMLSQQIDAKVKIIRDNGTRFEIEIPID